MGWWSSNSQDGSTAQVTSVASQTQSTLTPYSHESRRHDPDKSIHDFLHDLDSPSSQYESTRTSQTIHPPHSPSIVSQSPSTANDRVTLSTHVPDSATPDTTQPNHTLDISPRALYPRTMSCRQAFDQAFYCQSLGGKFNDIYRFGSLQSCSDNWNQFWFCMRTRTVGDEERERLITEFYERKDHSDRERYGNSEDVWTMRRTPVEKAFWRDPNEQRQ